MLDATSPDGLPIRTLPGEAGQGFAWTVLPRHGLRPLGFTGRLLLEASSRQPGLAIASGLAVHETADGRLVAAVRHLPDADLPRCYATCCATPAELLELLRAHDPLADLPAEPLFTADADDAAAAFRQVRALRAAWGALLDATFGPDPGTPSPPLSGETP
jgi:hypothetical protein